MSAVTKMTDQSQSTHPGAGLPKHKRRGKIAVALDELRLFPIAPLTFFQRHRHGVLLPSLTKRGFRSLRGIESVTDAFGYQTICWCNSYKPEMEEKTPRIDATWN